MVLNPILLANSQFWESSTSSLPLQLGVFLVSCRQGHPIIKLVKKWPGRRFVALIH